MTLALIKAALEQVPVNRLNDVYTYLMQLQEDAEDSAAIAESREDMVYGTDRGVHLDTFLRDRSLLDEVEEAAKTEGLTQR